MEQTQIEKQAVGYVEIKEFLKRRKWLIIIPWLLITGIAVIVAYLLPPIYQSSATILIESQQVPEDLMRTTVTGFAEERIKAITQQILSRQTLLSIIKEFNLYQAELGKKPIEQILDQMRSDISVEMVSVEVPNKRSGRPSTVNVAFTVSYEGKDPEKVMKVANRLTSLFLEHNLKMREEIAQSTAQFLERQAKKFKEDVARLEERLAAFKQQHITELPELMKVNFETERQLRHEIEAIDDQMKAVRERKIYLEGQLATISPNVPLTDRQTGLPTDPVQRLKALKIQAMSLEASLSSKHPDVVKLNKEIEMLEGQVKASKDRKVLQEMLELKRSELKQLLSKVTKKHPDVIRLEEEIKSLEEKLAKLPKDERMELAEDEPTNPAYINLKTQIKSAELELEGLRKKRQEFEKKWQEYVKRLEKMPEVERQYNDLMRDYEIATGKYREIMAKLTEAKQGELLEKTQAGERFTVIDSPQIPERPVKPNRPVIALIGFILGLGVGVGMAAIVESMDTTIRVPKDIKKVTGVPVLATIANVKNVKRG